MNYAVSAADRSVQALQRIVCVLSHESCTWNGVLGGERPVGIAATGAPGCPNAETGQED
jgi:hypothetical protein